jgi:hypothetical protein
MFTWHINPKSLNLMKIFQVILYDHKNAEYFTSDNEPGGIENATHNTFPKF